MDKYEYQVKTEEMLQYMDQKDYKKAMEIADGIDWKHVKNVLMLCKVSEIYEYNRDYQRSREVLFFAYDRRPGSRKIVYRLGTLALKLGDTNEAQDCYEEYVNLAPKDPNQYVLRYKIQKAKGDPIAEQIRTLEDFKKVEYIEKWAYELAKLYHEADRGEECLAECDDLILWFSEGKYVIKAMELKKQYKPLTPLQQEKYDQYMEEQKEAQRFEREKTEDQQVAEAVQEELPAEFRDRTDNEEIDIDADKNKILSAHVDKEVREDRDPKVSTFTGLAQALQAVSEGGAKIAEKLVDAVSAEEAEEPAAEEEPVAEAPEVPADEPAADEGSDDGEAATGLDALLASWENGDDAEAAPAEEPVEAAPAEEPVEAAPAEEPVGEIEEIDIDETAEDIPAEEPAEEPAPETAEAEPAEAPEEEEPIEVEDDDLADAAAEEPKVDAQEINLESFLATLKEEDKEPEEEEEEEPIEIDEPDEEAAEAVRRAQLDQEMAALKSAKTKKFKLHPDVEAQIAEEERLEEEILEDETADFSEDLEASILEDATDDFAEEELIDEFEEDEFEEDDFEEAFAEEDFDEEGLEEEFSEEDFDESDGFIEEDLPGDDFPEEELPQTVLPEDEFAEEDPFSEEEFEEFDEEDLDTKSPYDTDNIEIEDEIDERMNQSDGGVSFDTGFVVQGRYDLETQSEIGLKAGLTQEQKELFSYFVPVQGMSEQIVTVLENDAKCTDRYGTSRTGNLMIIGHKGSGKTVLAVDIVKALQKNRNLEKGRVAIVEADKLNRKDMRAIIGKLAGGALIIESAGALSPETVHQLNELMEGQTKEMFVVLEDEQAPISQLLAQYPEFASKFTSKLEVPVFINDDLVAFGQTYAKENGFKIDEMGILALYSRIDALQREDHAVTVAEVKTIMDEAMKRTNRKLFRRSKDGSHRILLQEADFQK